VGKQGASILIKEETKNPKFTQRNPGYVSFTR